MSRSPRWEVSTLSNLQIYGFESLRLRNGFWNAKYYVQNDEITPNKVIPNSTTDGGAEHGV